MSKRRNIRLKCDQCGNTFTYQTAKDDHEHEICEFCFTAHKPFEFGVQTPQMMYRDFEWPFGTLRVEDEKRV